MLKDYGIQKEHVLCIVTDNASNMLSMVKKINERPKKDSIISKEFEAQIQEEQLGSSHSSQQMDWNELIQMEEDSKFFKGFGEET